MRRIIPFLSIFTSYLKQKDNINMNLTSRIRERGQCSCIVGWRRLAGTCEQLIELAGSEISGTSVLASETVSLLGGTDF